MFEEKFQSVAAVYIVNKDNAFAFDELELEYDICKEEFVDFGASDTTSKLGKKSRDINDTLHVVLTEMCSLVLVFFQFQDCLGYTLE